MSAPLEKKDSEITVAVIIPFYNGSKFIRRSALSVINQTMRPNEFVVVDDGSTEEEHQNLLEIAREIGFTVLRKENGGQGSARNFGVENTKSKYICFLDQDDFFLKHHIETLVRGVSPNDLHFGWVYADLMEADGDGNISRTEMVAHHSSHPKRHITDLIGNDMFVLPSASLIGREAFEDVGGFDPQFTGYEDDDLFLRMFRRGYTNKFIDEPVTVWCINTDSTSYSIRMSRSRLKYIKKLCALFPDDKDKNRFFVRDLIHPRFTKLVIGEARRAVRCPSSKQEKKMRAHREELIAIMDEYIQVIRRSTKLKKKVYRRMLWRSRRIKIYNMFFGRLITKIVEGR
ncbi:glycosyltransferase family A protein [Agrobacterium sp. CCNWLW71]|uniref:glycosyltransferase family 2 protein n=1 Tax=unclassified Agrobacterium TaxID=2632611 RepID=UPI002FF0BC0B